MTTHKQCAVRLMVVGIIVVGAVAASGETRKEFRFTVGPKASVSVSNLYGPVSVKPASGNQVIVTAILSSDKVSIDQMQSGDRVSITSRLSADANKDTGRVDYEVLVPAGASVTVQSSTGPLAAEKLHGDVSLEGTTATVEVHDLSGGHVHIKTMDGPITLNNIHEGHVEITSVSGNVILNTVSGPLVQVNSSSGKIVYDGDFGGGGQYSLVSHSGDIEATAPAYASIDVTARSVKGQVENDFQLMPRHPSFVVRAGSAFAGTIGKAASSVKLLSFSGKIHLKKR
jgi:DUF4097 and DUF4098 domain-containing protein YvlB